jgi:hypothetical protein
VLLYPVETLPHGVPVQPSVQLVIVQPLPPDATPLVQLMVALALAQELAGVELE